MTAYLQHLAGERIQDRYEVISVLGSGAYGTVYKCCDLELNTVVAIKELHVLPSTDGNSSEREEALAQFRREAVNLSNLRHPHIVSGHYQPHSATWLVCPVCGQSFRGSPVCPTHGAAPLVVRQRHYLVMEYLDGPDLAEAARSPQNPDGKLEIRRALRYIRQIAEALQLIHSRGLVHRDIKPANIRLRADADDAVLLDFGIATQSGEAGDFSTRVVRHTTGGGTFGYAPESPVERRLPDARSDIHALGMTLYALVSGRDPLEDDDLSAMRALRPRDFNPQVSPQLEALILKSINSDPTKRPQNAAEFLHDMLAPSTVGSQPDGSPGGAMRTTASDTAAATALSTSTQFATQPVPSFVFRSGARASDVQDLVRLMDRDRQEAKEYLYNGDFATWLSQIGRADLAQRAREIVTEYPERKYQGLEALAQSTGLVEPPTLEVQPEFFDFGVLTPGARKTLPLKLRNVGRGHLFGLLRSTHPALVFDDKFEGNRHVVPVTFDARQVDRGTHRGEIVVDSSAGEMRVPFSAQVRTSTSFTASVTVMSWGVLGMIGGQLLRALPLAHIAGGAEWLSMASQPGSPTTSVLFGVVLWVILLLLTLGEATRRKSWALFFSGGAMALPAAILCGAMAGPLLIAGDAALHPLMEPVVSNMAASGWMIAGGIVGASYGTLRRLQDVFSTRLLQVLFGWLFFVMTLYGVVAILNLAMTTGR
jgi:serine/threonine protein kinase